MAAQTTWPVYDPWAKETPAAENLLDLRQFNQRCYALVKKVFDRNQTAGKTGRDLFRAFGILRARPTQHTVFNLAMKLPRYEIFPRDVGAVDCASAMNAAETLLNGEYRIAGVEEEAECLRRDADAHNAVMEKRAKLGAQNIAAVIGTMAKQAMGPVTTATVMAKGR